MNEVSYFVDHYEVTYSLRNYDDGRVMASRTELFSTEEDCLEFARLRYFSGSTVTVRRVELLDSLF